MTKYKEIGGTTFEVIKSRKTPEMLENHFKQYHARDLFDYYDNPSIRKWNIYNEWLYWFHDNIDNLFLFEVTSANTFKFTISCVYVDNNGNQAFLRITDAHNYMYV